MAPRRLPAINAANSTAAQRPITASRAWCSWKTPAAAASTCWSALASMVASPSSAEKATTLATDSSSPGTSKSEATNAAFYCCRRPMTYGATQPQIFPSCGNAVHQSWKSLATNTPPRGRVSPRLARSRLGETRPRAIRTRPACLRRRLAHRCPARHRCRWRSASTLRYGHRLDERSPIHHASPRRRRPQRPRLRHGPTVRPYRPRRPHLHLRRHENRLHSTVGQPFTGKSTSATSAYRRG